MYFVCEKGYFESKYVIILIYCLFELKWKSFSKYIYLDEESRKRFYVDMVFFLFKNMICEIE